MPLRFASDVTAAASRVPAGVVRVLQFGGVGLVGFAVDAGGTLGLAWFGLGALAARAVAIPLALAVTYGLNRTLTFRSASARGAGPVAAESLRYVLVATGSALFNWAVYAAALLAAPGLPVLAALVLGSVAAMAASYLGYSRYAFRRRPAGDRPADTTGTDAP